MAMTPEDWLNTMLDLPNTSLPPCATCEALFRPPGLSVWNKRPFARDVQSSGVACARCRLVYAGASTALPGVEAWHHVRLLAFLVVGREREEDAFLRVGALDYGPGPSVDHPRPWVDFYINPSDGMDNALSLTPGFVFCLHVFRKRLEPDEADITAYCVYQRKPEVSCGSPLPPTRMSGIKVSRIGQRIATSNTRIAKLAVAPSYPNES